MPTRREWVLLSFLLTLLLLAGFVEIAWRWARRGRKEVVATEGRQEGMSQAWREKPKSKS